MKKQPTLGDIYGQMLKGVQVVQESAQENINKSKKVPKQSKNAFDIVNEQQGIYFQNLFSRFYNWSFHQGKSLVGK